MAILKAANLAGLVRRASDHALDELGGERMLPVLPELRELLPGRGLRRGATVAIATVTPRSAAHPGGGVHPGGGARPAPTPVPPIPSIQSIPSTPAPARPARAATEIVAVDGRYGDTLPPRSETARSVGATSLLFALLAAASAAGSWCGVVGVPTLGAVAAAEAGIALDRLVLVPHPGPDWATVVAALLDGLDIVVAAPPGPIAPAVASRLTARARQRGSVLVSYGRWDGADLTFDAVRGVWHGLDRGHGRLRCRQLTILARGRGAAARPRRVEMWWPALSRSWASPSTVTDPAAVGPATADPATGGAPAIGPVTADPATVDPAAAPVERAG